MMTASQSEYLFTSELMDINNKGERKNGANNTTHVLQNTAIKFFKGVSRSKIINRIMNRISIFTAVCGNYCVILSSTKKYKIPFQEREEQKSFIELHCTLTTH